LEDEPELVRIHSQAIARARASARTVVSESFALQGGSEANDFASRGVRVFAPVYAEIEPPAASLRRAGLVGVMVGLMPMDRMFAGVEQLPEAGNVDFMLQEMDDRGGRIVYGGQGGDSALRWIDSGYERENRFKIGGREWRLKMLPRDALAESLSGRRTALAVSSVMALLSLGLAWGLRRGMRLRRAVQTAQQRLRQVTDNLAVGVFQAAVDRRGGLHVAFVTRGCGPIVGVPEDELIYDGNRLFERLDPPQRSELEQAFAKAAAAREVFGCELRIRLEEGWERNLALTATPYGEEAGRVLFSASLQDVTGEYEARTQLDALLEEQRALVDNVPIGIVIVEGGHVRRCNHSLARMLGYVDPAAVVGLEFGDLHVDDRVFDTLMRAASGKLDAGRLFVTEAEMRRRDGERFWAQLIGKRVLSASGGSRDIWILEDVSERRRAERILREQSELLALAQEAGGIGVFDLDLRSGKHYWSPQLETMFGHAPGSMPTTTEAFLTCLVDDDRERARQNLGAAITGGAERFADDWRVKRPDGRILHMRSEMRLFRDPEGRALRAVGVAIDVSDERRKQAELAAAFQFQQQLVDTIPTPLWFFDARGRISGCNRAFLRAFSVTREQVQGFDLAHIDGLPKALVLLVQPHVARLIDSPQTIELEGEIPFGDGSLHEVNMLLSGFLKADGSAGGVVGLIIDVTDERTLQRQLSRSGEQFRVLVDSIPGTVYRVRADDEARALFVSSGIEALTGHSVADLVDNGKVTLTQLRHPEDADEVAEQIKQAVAEHHPYSLEYRIVRRDGE
ncbi:MAG TPA: PAS domain S-box protein, partial [Arenimonas sp.]|nr:PAS domain S-box protein [Arenimonas sp.]